VVPWRGAPHRARPQWIDPGIAQFQRGTLDMKIPLKLFLTAVATAAAVAVSCEGLFARGGPPSIMDSAGYQRRLQESRQPSPQPDVQPSPAHRRKARHHRH
jgi:hypothetical protein